VWRSCEPAGLFGELLYCVVSSNSIQRCPCHPELNRLPSAVCSQMHSLPPPPPPPPPPSLPPPPSRMAEEGEGTVGDVEQWRHMWGARVKWPVEMPDDILRHAICTCVCVCGLGGKHPRQPPGLLLGPWPIGDLVAVWGASMGSAPRSGNHVGSRASSTPRFRRWVGCRASKLPSGGSRLAVGSSQSPPPPPHPHTHTDTHLPSPPLSPPPLLCMPPPCQLPPRSC
jgi:hypothetical protein